MATRKQTNFLTRQQKLFKMNHLLPLDANNLDIEEAFSRLFVYLRTNGRQITKSRKFTRSADDAQTPQAVIDALPELTDKIQGIDDPVRLELLTAWFESHFALLSRQGKTKKGDFQMVGLRPLHFAVIKLFNPRVRRQDRLLSDFLYHILKDDPILYTQPDSLFKQFFGIGVRPYGSNDYNINEALLKQLAGEERLEIELLFLLRLLEPFEADTFSTDKKEAVPEFSFLCPEQIDLMRQDLKLLFLYKDHIPRRELINYMITLMVFHVALYVFQTVKIINHVVTHGKAPNTRGNLPDIGEPRTHVPFDLNLYCDLSNGHDEISKGLSERCFIELFKEVEAYFRSTYLIKKLEEFAASYLNAEQRKQSGQGYIEFLWQGYRRHPDLNGYFNRDIQQIIENSRDQESGEENPEIRRIIDVCNQRKLDKLETFVEILLHFQYTTLREQHRKFIAGLCCIDEERGFMVGKGRVKRRFVLGNELLEVLIQLAVLEKRGSDGKIQNRPIPIRQFVDWLAGRYGLLIDRLELEPNPAEEEQVNRALAKNYDALKTRLRQLGFFTDLADASNSQVIIPRFPIDEAELDSGTEA